MPVEEAMDVQQVRLEFEAGKFLEALIEPSPAGNGWRMLFKRPSGEMVVLTEHGGAEKIVHSVDAATTLAREIGFQTIHVEEQF
jgi:hypothetical protein